ncbi:MAG: glycosyltransferase [Puniceicoccaceae bacterium]
MNFFEWILTVAFLAAGTSLLLYGVNCYWQIYFFRRGRKFLAEQSVRADRIESRLWKNPAGLPLVTTQIPLYNEFNVAERVLRAVASIDYPAGKHQIQVLDDSDDATRGLIDRIAAELRQEGHWIDVFRREERSGFKAGALKAGLAEARGEFIAIFDGDFVPGADFLRKTLPLLVDDEGLGLVQGRWTHLNPCENLLCRAQSIGIDGHFAIEQAARASNGFFLNFNGTAGLWRKKAILDSGDWQGDTLTEDMDLSYRAQLAGWRLAFRGEAAVPAELPASFTAFKNQQFRWAKGSIQTAKKLFPRVIRSDRSWIARLQAFLHLTHYGIHPFIVAVAALSLPMLFLLPEQIGLPVRMAGAFFILGAALGPNCLYLVSQRSLRPSGWRRQILLLPALTIVGLGISLSNSRGVIEGLLGIKSGFVRTPKRGSKNALRYRARGSWLVGLELFMGAYCLVAFILYAAGGAWGMSPFLLLYAAGYSYVGVGSLLDLRRPRGDEMTGAAETDGSPADLSSSRVAG